jgi:hypothetical protein
MKTTPDQQQPPRRLMTTARMFCRAVAALALWTLCGGAAHAFDYNGWWEIVGRGETGINVGQ